MPTYDYRCTACEHEFEAFQSMSAKPLRKCPACGKQKLERLIGTGAGLIFKGSGFYETDYRSESYKKAAEAEKKAGDAKPDGGKSGGDAPAGETGKAKPASKDGVGSKSTSSGTASTTAGSSG